MDRRNRIVAQPLFNVLPVGNGRQFLGRISLLRHLAKIRAQGDGLRNGGWVAAVDDVHVQVVPLEHCRRRLTTEAIDHVERAVDFDDGDVVAEPFGTAIPDRLGDVLAADIRIVIQAMLIAGITADFGKADRPRDNVYLASGNGSGELGHGSGSLSQGSGCRVQGCMGKVAKEIRDCPSSQLKEASLSGHPLLGDEGVSDFGGGSDIDENVAVNLRPGLQMLQSIETTATAVLPVGVQHHAVGRDHADLQDAAIGEHDAIGGQISQGRAPQVPVSGQKVLITSRAEARPSRSA